MKASALKPWVHTLARHCVACGIAPVVLALALAAPVTSHAATSSHAPASVPTAGQAAPMLHLGSRGAAVRVLRGTLARLGYLPASGVDGIFGMRTWHAVVALQGWSYLPRDGVVGPRTRNALARAQRPAPWSITTGFEIHVSQQVLLLVRRGRVERAIHVSTGAGGRTPLGHFRVYRRDPMSWSASFHVWMPLAQYFDRGYAMHEFGAVPPNPASHGCVRVPQAEARAVWQFGALGTRVWTRP